jgi:hypothetical protein
MRPIDHSRTEPPPALAIVNARVWTNDPRRRWADAVLVREGRLLAVGSSAELRKRAGAGAVIVDARGWLVLPARASDVLVRGAVATLLIVERATAAEPPEATDEDSVVFSLVEGRVVLDRRGLAG